MPDYRLAARRAAIRHGLDPDLYVNQIGAESNFDPNAGSSAGARGIAQIMPDTAKSWGVNLNDNRVSDDLDASAKNMAAYVKKYGSYENALRAYNAGPGNIEASRGFPETNAYVQKILNGSNSSSSGTPRNQQVVDASLRSINSSRTPGTTTVVPAEPSIFDVIRRYDVATDTDLSDEDRKMQQDLVDAAMRSKTTVQVTPSSTTSATDIPQRTQTGGKFKITGPNPGRLKPELVEFAERVAGIYGQPLTGSDGTGHSRLTVNGNVSQHSTGNATDIPASGKSLIEMGQSALIAAGMPEAEARKQKGGLFNVGDHQIIFNTHEGGDHTDHLHISARGRSKG